MSTPRSAPPRRRHLIDFDNPPPPSTERALTSVQRWIVSTLAVSTILHLCFGLVFAAYFADVDQQAARVGLLIVAGLFGTFAFLAGLAIHQRRGWSLLSPWLLMGWVPSAVGAFLIFG